MIALLAVAACKLIDPPDGDSGVASEVPTVPSLETTSYSDQSNGNGRVRVELEISPSVMSFQVTGQSVDDDYLTVQELIDPSGQTVLDAADWLSSADSLTQSVYITRPTMAFDWPVRDTDGPLDPGTWVLWLGHVNSFGSQRSNAPVDLTVTYKRDSDPTSATIGVQIVYADRVDQDPVVVEAIEAAVERWRKLWGDQGIELAEHYETSNLDPDSDFFFDGDNKVANVAGRKAPGELQLIVGERVAGDPLILGIAAAIPGTVEPSPHTFVILSWLSHAGPDGVFSDEEIRTMGETMAHEIGHYVGLFHPVETNFSNWDAIDDTDHCNGASRCEDALGRNVMYPYPLCTFTSCQAQGQLSAGQAAVLHQQVSAL